MPLLADECRIVNLSSRLMLDGPINRDAFQAYVDHVLVPALSPGDVVVTDNLSSQKGPGVRRAIEAIGARLLYFSPYSPDFNPIENAFANTESVAENSSHPNGRQSLGGDRPTHQPLQTIRI